MVEKNFGKENFGERNCEHNKFWSVNFLVEKIFSWRKNVGLKMISKKIAGKNVDLRI